MTQGEPDLTWVGIERDAATVGIGELIALPHLVQDNGRLVAAYIRSVKGARNPSPAPYVMVEQSFHVAALLGAAILAAASVQGSIRGRSRLRGAAAALRSRPSGTSGNTAVCWASVDGRGWFRTSDLSRVKSAQAGAVCSGLPPYALKLPDSRLSGCDLLRPAAIRCFQRVSRTSTRGVATRAARRL